MEGGDVMTSLSRSERSLINIKFNLARDPDAAAADVRDKVSRARRYLPDEIDEPIISKVEADSTPIIYIGVSTGNYSHIDRKSVASGKSVSVRVDLGGRRIIKTHKKTKKHHNELNRQKYIQEYKTKIQ